MLLKKYADICKMRLKIEFEIIHNLVGDIIILFRPRAAIQSNPDSANWRATKQPLKIAHFYPRITGCYP